MTDIRTLLDDATARTPYGDPVAAVRARVRRRAARRRTAVATGTTFAVAATGTLAATARGDRPVRLAASPSASSPPSGAAGTDDWRQDPNPFLREYRPQHADGFERLRKFVDDRLDVFVGLAHEGAGNPEGWQITVSLEAGADPDYWRRYVARAAGSLPWGFKQCGSTAERYDEIAAEVAAAAWPSGDHVVRGPSFYGVTYVEPCQVDVQLAAVGPHPHDIAYASKLWGDQVRVTGRKPGPSVAAPVTGDDASRPR